MPTEPTKPARTPGEPPGEPPAETPAGGLVARARQLVASPQAGLLLLRAFLGVTFTFAGLQKLANPGFFHANTPGSIQEQLNGAAHTTPVHFLVALALHAPVFFGVVISVCELAVGLGTLFGFLARVAAGGGMLLSLTFFLTISFRSSPYYYGSDIVFLFAWTPFLLQGAGPISLDRYLGDRWRAAREEALRVTHRARGRERRLAEIDRRAALTRGVLAGAGGALTLVLGGAVAAIGHALAPPERTVSSSPTLGGAGGGGGGTGGGGTGGGGTGGTGSATGTTSTTGAGTASVPKGTKIGPASAVPVGGAASFDDPASGEPAYVLQPTAGRFVAFSGVCTHAGCTVQFDQANTTFNCPCHGSIFDAKTGQVIQGPASMPLPPIPIAEGGNGQLYVDG